MVLFTLKIFLLSVLSTYVSCYTIIDDDSCEGIQEARSYFLNHTGVEVVCALKADNTTGVLVDTSKSSIGVSIVDDADDQDEDDDFGVSLSGSSYIDPMYLYISNGSDYDLIKRTDDCVKIQRHDKWVQGCVNFISDVGSSVLSSWIQSLSSWIIKHSESGSRTKTTWYEHGLYFDIVVEDSTSQEVSTLEGALDKFFKEHSRICYSYCLGIDHSGNWHAYIKMYRQNEPSSNTAFTCTSANHFSDGCSYKAGNGDVGL